MSKKADKKKKRAAEQKRNIEKKKVETKKELNKKEAKKVEKNKKDKKDKKDKKQNAPSKKKKIIKRIIWVIFIILLIILIYLLARPKFKDITIELGTKEIKVEDFLVSKIYEKGAKQVTKLKDIDLSKVGENKITLKFLKKEETVKLKIVDTTAPKVKFKEHN